MEYPCYQCGAAVGQGVAFCPECKSPQIRVAVAEPAPAFDREAAEASYSHPVLTVAHPIDWSRALPAIALAGLIGAILMLTPLAVFGLGMLTAGALSVVFYRRRDPGVNLTAGMGSRLGMASGVLGGCIFTVLLFLGTVMLHAWSQIRQKVIDVVEQTAARNSDPQAQQALEFFKTDQGIALLVASALVGTLLAFVIFSGLGGALGAALMRQKDR